MSRVVLVVDDEPLVLEVTVSMLEDMGCDVVTAANGKGALDQLSADLRIEILITDVNMPNMDGFALAHSAMGIRKQLKVILMSGQESDGHGFPVIRKPFQPEDLRRTLARHTGVC